MGIRPAYSAGTPPWSTILSFSTATSNGPIERMQISHLQSIHLCPDLKPTAQIRILHRFWTTLQGSCEDIGWLQRTRASLRSVDGTGHFKEILHEIRWNNHFSSQVLDMNMMMLG
uniref:Uncharacterized protein n=1 Tax=Zea mays TaxID=4577 RepID=A0A804PBS2_MAIZE